jgi:hypothetical protein
MIDLPIVRLYATAEQARIALASLQRWGFEPELITVVGPPAIRPAGMLPPTGRMPGSERDDDALAGALRGAGIPASHVAHYAGAVRNGATLVSVQAPFGTGGIAEELLDSGDPVVPEHSPFHTPLLPSNLAAPLSSALGLPTVTAHGRTTSEAIGLPTVSREGRATSEAVGIPTLASPDHFTFGTPRVSHNPAPFSSLFGLPVLTRSRREGSRAR